MTPACICAIFKLFVCITDLSEQKSEALECRLSTMSGVEDETFLPQTKRRRTSSILEKAEPNSLATVQSSDHLSYMALFEGVNGLMMAVGTMAIGPAITTFGFAFPGWLLLGLTALTMGLSLALPNTKALWDDPAKKRKIPEESDLDALGKLLSISSDDKEELPNPTVIVTPKKKIRYWIALKKAFSFLTVPIVIGVLVELLVSMVAHMDVMIFNLCLIGEPYKMTISQVGITIGIRTIGCSVVTGLFAVFNMFYLQPRLATSSNKQTKLKKSKEYNDSGNHNGEDVTELTDAEMAAKRPNKVHETRRIMLLGLGSLLVTLAASRFLYGISSSFQKPTCLILMFIGVVLNSFQFFGPLNRALLSGLVSCEVQGRLYAFIGLGGALGGFAGMTSFPAIFASTVFMNAGFVFYVAALILAFAFILVAVDMYLLLYGKYK
ncbi:hypothetical protein Aperf_G00000013391 [Anoplocephala perfoliata]